MVSFFVDLKNSTFPILGRCRQWAVACVGGPYSYRRSTVLLQVCTACCGRVGSTVSAAPPWGCAPDPREGPGFFWKKPEEKAPGGKAPWTPANVVPLCVILVPIGTQSALNSGTFPNLRLSPRQSKALPLQRDALPYLPTLAYTIGRQYFFMVWVVPYLYEVPQKNLVYPRFGTVIREINSQL